MDQVNAELLVLANSHRVPISDRQRLSMRTVEQVESEIDQILKALPTQEWRQLLINAWMPECMEELAAIKVVRMSHEFRARLEAWETAVAGALAGEEQSELNRLFANPIESVTEHDLFVVQLPPSNGKTRTVVRDWRGLPLTDSFWLTALHRINDLTSRSE